MIRWFFIIAIIGLLLGCKAEKPINEISKPAKSMETMIAFLTFRFAKDGKDSLRISLEAAIWSAGSLRETEEEIADTAFQFTFYDDKGALVATKYAENPLNREVEYVDENNSFNRKKVNLKDELLTMRLALPQNTVKAEVRDSFGIEIGKIEF